MQEMLLWATSSQETEAALEEEGFLGGGRLKSAQYTAAVTYEGPCFLAAYP